MTKPIEDGFAPIDLDAAQKVMTCKVPTTPRDLAQGVVGGIALALKTADRRLSDIQRLVYGTTLVTNLIVEKSKVPVGLITTKNFRDILAMGRAYRPEHIYDLNWRPPAPLVPRHLRPGVPERIDARGKIILPLDEEAVFEALRTLGGSVDSIAVCEADADV